MVAAVEHGSGRVDHGRLEIVRSSQPNNIEKWDVKIQLRNSRTTYARLLELQDGKILLFCRLSINPMNSRASFYSWESLDAGETWVGPVLVVDSDDGRDDAIYLCIAPTEDEDSVHFIFNKVNYNDPIPKVKRYVSIYYLQYGNRDKSWRSINGSDLGPIV